MANENITEDLDNCSKKVSYTSQIEEQNFAIEWIIKDFEFVCKTMDKIYSPCTLVDKPEDEYFVELELVDLNQTSKEDFIIKVQNNAVTSRYLNVQVSILNASGQGQHFNSDLRKRFDSYSWSVSSAKLYESLLNNNSISKNVTVNCKIRVFELKNYKIEKSLNDSLKFEDISKQIESFFYEEDIKDITIVVEDREFLAHKAILALKSPVFAAMFKSKMTEKLNSVIEIEDITETVFEKMLQFIYTEKVQELEKFALDLFYAAEKYQLTNLKNECINCLCKNLSLKSVLSSLELADLFSISVLKHKSMKYLILHLHEIKGMVEYTKLMKDRPHLAIEIVDMRMENARENENEDKQIL